MWYFHPASTQKQAHLIWSTTLMQVVPGIADAHVTLQLSHHLLILHSVPFTCPPIAILLGDFFLTVIKKKTPHTIN